MKWMRLVGGVVVGIAACLGQGCVSSGIISEPKPVISSAVQRGGTGAVGSDTFAASQNGLLSMGISIKGDDPASREVANRVKERLVGSATDAGFIVDDVSANVSLMLDLSVTQFDRSGSYYVYEGELTGELKRTFDGRMLSTKSLSARGKRGLGQDKALKNLAQQLTGPTVRWFGELDVPAKSGLKAEDVTISKRLGNFSKGGAAYTRMFIKEVSGLPGVVDCRFLSQPEGSREIVFRVVYDPLVLPEGLMNAILSVKELKLRSGR